MEDYQSIGRDLADALLLQSEDDEWRFLTAQQEDEDWNIVEPRSSLAPEQSSAAVAIRYRAVGSKPLTPPKAEAESSSSSADPVEKSDGSSKNDKDGSSKKNKAGKPSLIANKKKFGRTILAYGAEAATDPAVADKLADAYIRHKRGMVDVLERRQSPPPSPTTALDDLIPPPPEPKYKSLENDYHSAIVDGVRPPDEEDFVADLRKEARNAVLKASKSVYTPSSTSASTYIQLRRMALEREFGGEKFRLASDFCMPGDELRGSRKARTKLAERVPSTSWVGF